MSLTGTAQLTVHRATTHASWLHAVRRQEEWASELAGMSAEHSYTAIWRNQTWTWQVRLDKVKTTYVATMLHCFYRNLPRAITLAHACQTCSELARHMVARAATRRQGDSLTYPAQESNGVEASHTTVAAGCRDHSGTCGLHRWHRLSRLGVQRLGPQSMAVPRS